MTSEKALVGPGTVHCYSALCRNDSSCVRPVDLDQDNYG